MAAIFQTTFWNGFSWMKMFEYRLKFHWNLFLRVQLTIFQHWFRWWLGAVQATSHYLNQWWLVYRRIYASLGLNELIHVMEIKCHRTCYTYIYPLCSEICCGNIKCITFSLIFALLICHCTKTYIIWRQQPVVLHNTNHGCWWLCDASSPIINHHGVNSSLPGQNGPHFAGDIFKCIFLNENVWIPINISLKFVLKCQIDDIPTLVWIMALCWPGDKPLTEPMMISLLMHICVIHPHWFNSLRPSDAYMHR